MYDPACYDLAQRFLPDGIDDKITCELAEEIQSTIETFIYFSKHAVAIASLEAEDYPAKEAKP